MRESSTASLGLSPRMFASCSIWELSRLDVVHDDEKGGSKFYTPGEPQVTVIIS